ncbi:MAG: hypothetical protein IPM29_29425 [Planctomycetes bacterium]|nr:hypothetical protein [Planctomycetota bacterium]
MRNLASLCVLSALGLAAVSTAQWTQIQTLSAPSARAGAVATFDSARGETVLFGGEVFFSFSNETWVYDGNDWTRKSPSTSPRGRAEAAMVMKPDATNPANGVVWLYGGNAGGGPFGGPANDETWEWNGSNWRMLSPAATPGGLTRAASAYDASRGVMVVYGGLSDSAFPIANDAVWEFDGNTWTQNVGATGPGPREGSAMCHDAARGRIVMFGGVDPQIGGFGDTWEYDGTSWTRLPVSVGSPGPRTRSSMVYDSHRNVCLLYGGQDPTNGNILNDVWQFDGSVWTQLGSSGITARAVPAAAFDADREHTVLFGGIDSRFQTNAETWEYGARWDAFGAGCSGSAGTVALDLVRRPVLGENFVLAMSNLNASATTAFLAFGVSDSSWGASSLPFDLTPFGLTGCTLYVSLDVVAGTSASAGSATFSLPIPVVANLVGLRAFNQAFAPDAGHNPAGVVTSNAGTAVVGH